MVTAWLDTVYDNNITVTVSGAVGMRVWGYESLQTNGQTRTWVDRKLREQLTEALSNILLGEKIPLDVINGLGLGFTPPDHEDGLRCHYDAGNYQMAVEPIIWRTYEQTIPADAVELNIGGHRAAQYWIMKPTDWNDRWWVTCMITFKTSYGLINQSLFYSPIESPDRPDCLQTNLQRANQLVPFYKF